MLLFSLEGFSPAAMSCYGASWNRTEAIDALAASGSTWDRVITPVTDPVEQLGRWLGSSKFPAEEMTVVTDDERLGELSVADRIGELIVIPSRGELVADTLEETALAALTAIAAEQLADNPHVWLHSRFLTQCWDAPRDLFPVDQLDEEDLEPMDPSESIEHELNSTGDVRCNVPPILGDVWPPDRMIGSSDDPDWIMAWMRTYGCQIRLVDAMVGVLSLIAAASNQKAMLLTGTSGFALGQNGWVGHRSGPLRSCHLNVPQIMGVLNANTNDVVLGAGIRDRRVTSADALPDVIASLIDDPKSSPIAPEVWAARDDDDHGHTRGEEKVAETPSVVTMSAGVKAAVTTANWFYVRGGMQAAGDRQLQVESGTESPHASGDGSRDPGNLFLKPDDLNDVNDVARLRQDVAEEFEAKLT
ncbi:hypothetical protein [Aporhodopirellula aestuarii]|uniref:Uncharacterized protein n=1 Tax=Aporhodopirellula aestuarii TaxID=2950107 RepID=A0ABT0U0Q8_9BACT|nr:hypothetical protein [Aporhodopirellula aestuarii]MCM2370427.1 hypothetical protein [Aporhodopirellula aestuarii]